LYTNVADTRIVSVMSDFRPWITYPPLTQQRLSIVANVICRARNETLVLYDPTGGDNSWSHGCRAYARTCHALRETAKQHEWLRILPEFEPLRFTFAIGTVPIRFYRGLPDEPPSRYLETTYAEVNQLQMALEIEGLRPLDTILRLAIETDPLGDVTQVSLIELDEAKNITNTHVIPLGTTALSKVIPAQTKAIDVPPLNLEPLENRQSQLKTKKKSG